MNTKMLPMFALAAIALMAVPTSQAAFEREALSCDTSEFIQFENADSASAIYVRDYCSVASGCTTQFVSAQSTTTNTYVGHMYNDPISVASLISWHLSLSLGTAFNGVDYALCLV